MKKKYKKLSVLWLGFITLLSIAAPFIANEKPFFFDSSESKTGYTDYRQQRLDGKNNSGFFALIPYSSGVADAENSGPHSPFEKNYYHNSQGKKSVIPLRFHHWMGTDAIGSDVAAGVVFGLRHSLFIAVTAMVIALIIALVLGILSGYYSMYGVRISWSTILFFVFLVWAIWFYGYHIFSNEWRMFFSGNSSFYFLFNILFIIIILTSIILVLKKISDRISFLRKEINISPDRWITVTTQLFISVPQLILIITLSVFFQPSAFKIAVIFGLLMWTDLSRVIRAEVLKMKQEGFIESCIASGLSTSQIVFRHIIPNLKTVVRPLFLFGLATVILTESGLSFLGLGMGPDTVTLGSLLAQAKENMDAWWLMLFPGVFLFVTILSLFNLGNQNNLSSN